MKIWAILPLIGVGVLVTFVTGQLFGNYAFSFGGTTYWVWGYGFPLNWKTGGCPPPGSHLGIVSRCLPIGYNWFAFGLDVLFYTAVQYGLLLIVYRQYRPQKP